MKPEYQFQPIGEVLPRYEGDFATIYFPPNMAKYLPKLKHTDPEAWARFEAAISGIEIVLLDSGYVGARWHLAQLA